jgi:LruC domain-containing protein/uncharacterized repeat protein (TIGR01451 family)
MKKEILNILKLAFSLVLFLMISLNSFGQSYVIDLQENPMSFTNAERTVITNTGNNGFNEGSVHRYDNIATVDGKVLYGLLTLEELHQIEIKNFDDDAITGDTHRFQPRLGSGNNNGGYIVYKLQFFNTADDLPVFLYNYWMTGVDIDGNGNNREYEEVGGYTNYETDASCELTISPSTNGRTKFYGIDYSLSGVTFENKASWIANFTNPNNEITFAMGQSGKNNERYYSVQFGEKGGDFTDPVITPNPVPLAVDDVSPVINSGTGGTAIATVLNNDVYDGNPITAGDVNISIVTSPPTGIVFNTTTGEVSVTPGTAGGEYTFIYRICMVASSDACDIATVTVTVVEADLEIEKTASVTEVEQGQAYVYTLTVTNNGASDAEDVEVSDLISSNLTIINTTPSKGTWSSSTWSIGDMDNGDSETLIIAVETSNSFSGSIENSATVSSPTHDPDLTNNSSSVSVNVTESVPVINNFPATGFGTLAFEDLWPGKGDYDFNDLVIDYKFEINTNSSNYINEVIGTFVIKAFGAGMENGFGFQIPRDIDQTKITVSGYHLTESYITLSSNGVESGQTNPTIIVFDNAYNEMPPPGGSIGVNTTPGAIYVDPVTITVTITFPADTYTSSDLDIANFNPFLIVNQDRGIEVHLPDYSPTSLVDESYFGTADDDSNSSTSKYYKTANNLPWAINLYETFDYPVEKANITTAHLKFIDWATSGGTAYDDWYKDIDGYRNDGNIFVIP